ncbi:discoidin domain-containing protein [Accumulibacter sp.]|uniref:discoidin domain-containing protein n=1 Tax=Accumulibacter sp. TaxID=2053492 RepID=UPI002614DF28|nr:discoidin domain-containing protein [Accumulibacter sp.]
MRKRLIRAELVGEPSPADAAWLDIEAIAEAEISSEDAAHPIEAALLADRGGGWRAAGPGRQTIRLNFAPPQHLHRIRLVFVETTTARTQEYLLRWSADGGRTFQDIVRQQWNFDPQAAARETEEHRVDLPQVTVLELLIDPDIAHGLGVASLAQLRLA